MTSTFNILVTRPIDQVGTLQSLMALLKWEAVYLPVLEIHPLPLHPAATQLTDIQIIIFTSRNAVECGTTILNNLDARVSILAIGAATADTLKERGVQKVQVPDPFSSEGLLALPSLQTIQNKTIAIVTGKNSRALLKDTLMQRGAIVKEIFSYERRCPNYDAAFLETMAQQTFDAILVYSLESLQNLQHIFSHHRAWLLAQPLIVVTNKIKAQAMSDGFVKVPWVSEQVSDVAVIETIQKLRSSPA